MKLGIPKIQFIDQMKLKIRISAHNGNNAQMYLQKFPKRAKERWVWGKYQRIKDVKISEIHIFNQVKLN